MIDIDRYFIAGPYHPPYPSLKVNMYKILRKRAAEFARSINRELAEGPTIYLPDNFYGSVELWPLVIEEGEEDSLSGETIPALRSR
jgi:hypothetical protein